MFLERMKNFWTVGFTVLHTVGRELLQISITATPRTISRVTSLNLSAEAHHDLKPSPFSESLLFKKYYHLC